MKLISPVKPKPFYLALVNFLLLGLVVLAFPSEQAQAQTARIEIVETSGATGSVVTIRGFNQARIGFIREVDLYFVDPARPGYILIFGAATIDSNGTFTWRGPLPRGGEWLAFEAPERTGDVPLGNISIGAGKIAVSESGRTTFNVTANTNGPYVTKSLLSLSQMNTVWERTDRWVEEGRVRRSWLWGPSSISFLEPYQEAPNGWRMVTYLDKARMEVTNPNARLENNPYFVTNGLLVREMVTGRLQVGDNAFQNIGAANIPPAGDFSPANRTPALSAYAPLQTRNDNILNKILDQALDPQGNVFTFAAIRGAGITAAYFVPETNHYIASPFWEFLNSSGLIQNNQGQAVNGRIFDPLFSATGFPITEAYWTRTLVAGEEVDVLVQLFERRILTYTPSNPREFQVEMGNVGLQYYRWRYNI
jgi:hypothetical protein